MTIENENEIKKKNYKENEKKKLIFQRFQNCFRF